MEDRQLITVLAIDENNCQVSTQAVVTAKACNPAAKCIAIPTAFTPNSDGKNDLAGPVLNGCLVKSIRFTIYNRWGELIYETDKTGTGWNGMWKGVAQDSGVFVFLCEYSTHDGIEVRQRGTVTLIR
jgi:gliding motility-associated-like protein